MHDAVSSGTRLDPLAGHELVAFVAAYETGSLQGAADALSLTQSAVTKRVQSLERRLGEPVFERGRFGVRPTRLGQTIYTPAKQALAQLEEVAQAARAGRERGASDLKISASHTIAEFLLPEWLSDFRRLSPAVHPQLEVINSPGAIAAVREGRSTIGFIEGRDSLAGLERMTVASDELAVVVASGHPWARRRTLTVADLSIDAYLTREAGSGTRAVAAAALATAGIKLEPAMEAASTQSLKRALASSGFTIISRLAIVEEQRASTLVGRSIRGVDLSRELVAIRRSRRSQTAGARAFWQWLTRSAEHGNPGA